MDAGSLSALVAWAPCGGTDAGSVTPGIAGNSGNAGVAGTAAGREIEPVTSLSAAIGAAEVTPSVGTAEDCRPRAGAAGGFEPGAVWPSSMAGVCGASSLGTDWV